MTRILDDIGRVVEDVFHWLGRDLFHPIGHSVHLAFGDLWPLPVAALLVVVGVVGARLVIRRGARRAPTSPAARRAALGGGSDDPAALEALADQAEAAGRFAEAVRLRFTAGLAALERAGLVSGREAKTDRALVRELESPTFRQLAQMHEAVTFADRTATANDAATARRNWPQVAPEARRRANDHVSRVP